jgi:poly-gamma-glutamate synthesis protein (capsule biosynthesis protein)
LINKDSCINLWDEIGSHFFGSDIVFANLETPIDINQAKGFVPEVMLNNMYFNGDEDLFAVFSGNGQYKGYDVLSFANNHTLDKGKEGLLNTIKFLENKSILPVGVASSKDQKTYQIINKNGIKVAFLAYTYSLNAIELKPDQAYMVNLLPLNLSDCPLDQVKKEVISAKEEGAELIVISVHAGNAYQAFPSHITVNLYERLFNECGVDIIAGGHPHNLQPWKYYQYKDPFTQKEKKGFAIFSLADFVAYDIYTWCHLCAYLTIEVLKFEDLSIDFNVKVHPTVMEWANNKFKLMPADSVFSKKQLSDEEVDLKALYDQLLGVYG